MRRQGWPAHVVVADAAQTQAPLVASLCGSRVYTQRDAEIVTKIQAVYRGKVDREEAYWDAMGYRDGD